MQTSVYALSCSNRKMFRSFQNLAAVLSNSIWPEPFSAIKKKKFHHIFLCAIKYIIHYSPSFFSLIFVRGNPSLRFRVPDLLLMNHSLQCVRDHFLYFFIPHLPPLHDFNLCVYSGLLLPMEEIHRNSLGVCFFIHPLQRAVWSGFTHYAHIVYVCGLQIAWMKIGPCMFLH